jgi:hypothetical protein
MAVESSKKVLPTVSHHGMIILILSIIIMYVFGTIV